MLAQAPPGEAAELLRAIEYQKGARVEFGEPGVLDLRRQASHAVVQAQAAHLQTFGFEPWRQLTEQCRLATAVRPDDGASILGFAQAS